MSARRASANVRPMLSKTEDKSAVARNAHELERVAEKGESPVTPLILLGEVWVVCVVAVLVLLALALLAYRLAS